MKHSLQHWRPELPSVILDARSVLEIAGFRVALIPDTRPSLYFEDKSVLGVLFVTDTVGEILSDWRSLQDQFIRRNSSHLMLDPLKAWNLYSIFLTPDVASASELSKLSLVEEDFRSTRKIVRAGVIGMPDVETSLGALIPLRRILSLAPDDIKQRLGDRLGGPGAPLHALLDTTEVGAIAAKLLEAQ